MKEVVDLTTTLRMNGCYRQKQIAYDTQNNTLLLVRQESSS